jgi:very-short-patch-repair endonuclease
MTLPRIMRARRLRRTQTRAEALLWDLLRGRDFEGLKFRRQAPLGPYTVDFLCLKHRLIVELDGGIHEAPFYDLDRQRARDAWLEGQRFTVLRLRNAEVEHHINDVLARIRNVIASS